MSMKAKMHFSMTNDRSLGECAWMKSRAWTFSTKFNFEWKGWIWRFSLFVFLDIYFGSIMSMKDKMATWQKNSHFAIWALLSLCIDFKIFFCKMTYGWVLWKSYYTLLLKKCLRPCLGLSMYLSERINWIISSFPRWISKILFVLGSWDHFGSLGCRIGECPFFHDSILFLGNVSRYRSKKDGLQKLINSFASFWLACGAWSRHGPIRSLEKN